MSERQRPQATPEDPRAEQRRRILDALAACAAEKGYEATTIAEIATRARVSKRTFYRHFADKREALEAVVGSFIEDAEGALRASGATELQADDGSATSPPWEERVRKTLAALLETMAARPTYSQVAFLEGGGPAGGAPPSAGEKLLAPLFEAGQKVASGEGSIPASAGRAALGGAQALVVDRMIADRTDQLPELLPEMVYAVLVPYLGQTEAVRQSRLAASQSR